VAADDGLVVMRRTAPPEAPAGPADVLVIVALSRAGRTRLDDGGGGDPPGRRPWSVVLSTEDPCYCDDGRAVRIAIDDDGLDVTFERPGAVILGRSAAAGGTSGGPR
jgi:hypothetical protein